MSQQAIQVALVAVGAAILLWPAIKAAVSNIRLPQKPGPTKQDRAAQALLSLMQVREYIGDTADKKEFDALEALTVAIVTLEDV